jgi:hypothetical protein
MEKTPGLEMNSDDLVQVMIQLYMVSAALNINDIKYRDSTALIYYGQVAKITGRSMETIKSDFEKLQLMPDSLILYQGRALDSLRLMQERGFVRPSINLGIN